MLVALFIDSLLQKIMRIVYIYILVLFIVACTKEESCVHRLEGDWILSTTNLWENGVSVVDTVILVDSLEYTTTVVFSGYDEDIDEGNMSKVHLVTYTDSLDKTTVISSTVESQRYTVNNSCNQIILEGVSDTTTADNTTITITELTKSILIYEYIVDGDSIKYKYQEILDKK